MRAMPAASLRSFLLICIFNAALACRASMQMTGSPSSFNSLQSHVAVARLRPRQGRPNRWTRIGADATVFREALIYSDVRDRDDSGLAPERGAGAPLGDATV